jgi:predicted nucleotidyltransferase
MAVDIEAIKQVATNFSLEAKKTFPVRKTYLFGSYAKGIATELSDVDICFFVESYGNKTRFEIIAELLGIGGKFKGVPFEPIVFPYSEIERGNPFIREILSTGIEL